MKTTITFCCTAAAALLAACGVKDPIYNTAHPDRGQITLTTEWTPRTAGVNVPASYTVAVGGYSATVSAATNTLDNLFEPGTYHARIYNTPEHITVSGATVTVAETSGNADGGGGEIRAGDAGLALHGRAGRLDRSGH